MSRYSTKTDLGHTWIRTDATIEALEPRRGHFADMQALADAVAETIADNTGLQVHMLADGWAALESAQGVLLAAEYIDTALDALLG